MIVLITAQIVMMYQSLPLTTEADPELKKIIPTLPDVVEGGKSTFDTEGTIVYTRIPYETEVLARMKPDGEIFTQSLS